MYLQELVSCVTDGPNNSRGAVPIVLHTMPTSFSCVAL